MNRRQFFRMGMAPVLLPQGELTLALLHHAHRHARSSRCTSSRRSAHLQTNSSLHTPYHRAANLGGTVVFTRISVLMPTRGRLPRLEQMLDSYFRTESGCSELVFRIDNDDHESADFLRARNLKVMQGDRLLGYKSTPQFLIDMIPLATGDVFMVGNDDILFETQEWDRKIIKEANRYPDGLFNIGVTTLNTTHFPFSIVSRFVVEKLGFMYDPRIFWGDIFLRDVMFGFGRTVLLPEVVINHNWAGYKPDKTFMEAQNFKETVGTHEYWELNAVIVQEAIQKLRGVAQV